uniref:Transposase n=1 Tax=Leptospirillum ferrodiazotrophum TaxID=412449 RepID=C6HWQ5_9BACT|nr:MAG: transposase [Leptospirillum ferrodiazotrophum]EES53031.1 MAG: probable transposase [Leptospirillum ferrodiazotrophum]
MVRNDLTGIKLKQTTEPLTGQGGFLAFGEYLRGVRLRERVSTHLPAPGSNRGFGPDVFVHTLITLLILGGQTLSDLRELEREKPLLDVLGQTVIPDEDTVGQWLRRMGDPKRGQGGLGGLGRVRDEICREILARDGITEYTLDLDASFIQSGKADAKYSYLKEKGYMPMLAALYENGLFVDDEFREGNVSPAAGHGEVYRRAKARVEAAGKRIARFRADSAS